MEAEAELHVKLHVKREARAVGMPGAMARTPAKARAMARRWNWRGLSWACVTRACQAEAPFYPFLIPLRVHSLSCHRRRTSGWVSPLPLPAELEPAARAKRRRLSSPRELAEADTLSAHTPVASPPLAPRRATDLEQRRARVRHTLEQMKLVPASRGQQPADRDPAMADPAALA